MKLKWATQDNLCWKANFGLLELCIDYDREKYGIYLDGPVWEACMTGYGQPSLWTELAESLEGELQYRLLLAAEELTIDPLQPPPKCRCAVCGVVDENLHEGFYVGDQLRCTHCLREFVAKVAAESTEKDASDLVSELYWCAPFTLTPNPPSNQVQDAIKAEAETVKL